MGAHASIDAAPTSGAERSPSVPGSRRRALVLLALALGIASFVAFWRVDQANVGADETTYQLAALAYLSGDLEPNPEHPPAAKLLLGVWQVSVGAGIDSARVAMGVVLLLTAAVAFVWIRAAVGTGAAFAAAVMLATTHRVVSADYLDRQVMLDPFSVLFAIAGLAVLWRWTTTRHPALAAAAGALLALAILSKAAAAASLAGAFALVPWRELRKPRVWGSIVLFAAVGVVVCLLVYLPFGGIDAVHAMIAWQAEHAEDGHRIEVAGTTYQHAPWFAVAWFTAEVVGWPAFAAIAAAAAIALALRGRDAAVRSIGAAGAASLVLLSASPVALPHYVWSWLWAALLLSGIGIAELWRRARGRRGAVVAGVATAALLLGPVTGVAHLLSIRPTGVARVDAAMAADPAPDGTILALQLTRHVVRPNVDAPFTTDPDDDGITAVVIGDDLRYPADPALVALLDAETEAIVLDDVRLYLLDEELDELLAGQR